MFRFAFLLIFSVLGLSSLGWADPVYLKRQQELYQKQEWNRFFGRAIFFRSHLKDPGRTGVQNVSAAQVLSLEALALGQKCRWEEGLQVVASAEVLSTEGHIKELLFRTQQALLLDAQFFGKLSSSELLGRKSAKLSATRESKMFETKMLWKLSDKQLKAVKNPEQLRVEVENLCPKRMPASVAEAFVTKYRGELLHGLATYASGDFEKATSLLETAIQSPGISDEAKARGSFVLAFASNLLLSEKKRHEYAEMAYELRQYLNLADDSLAALLRIAGDGRFDENQLPTARRHYEKMLGTAQDSALKAYADYRLGWVELNEGKVYEALSRWLTLLETKKSELKETNRALSSAIERDVGRQWVELAESSSSNRDALREVLQRAPVDSPEFLQGFASKLDKISAEKTLVTIRESMKGEEHAVPMVVALSEKGYFTKRDECSALPWIEALELRISHEQVMRQALLCGKQVQLKNQCGKHEEKRVSTLLAKMPLGGEGRLAQGGLAVQCGDWKVGCEVLGTEILASLEKKKIRLSREVEETFARSCIEANQGALPERVLDAWSKTQMFLPKGIEPMEHLTGLVFSNPVWRNKWKLMLTSSPQVFSQTRLPQLLWAAYPSEERTIELKKEFLSSYQLSDPKGWEGVKLTLVQDLISAGKPSEARRELEAIKSSQENEEALWNAWGLYFLALPENELKNVQAMEQVKKWMIVDVKNSKWVHSSAELYLTLGLKSGELNSIWGHWASVVGTLQKHGDWASAFYEASFNRLSTLDPQVISKIQPGRGLVAFQKALEAKKGYSFKASEYFGKAKLAFITEADVLKAGAKHSEKLRKGRLSISPSLPRVIAAKMKALSQQRNLALQSHSSLELVNAELIARFEGDQKQLASEMEKLKRQVMKKPELSGLVDQLDQMLSQINLPLKSSENRPQQEVGEKSSSARTPSSGRVIDLGEVELATDLRRPSLTWLDSQKTVRDHLSQLVRKELREFESSLLSSE